MATKNTPHNAGTSKGITLIELIMVIVIVGLLVGASSMYIKETIGLWRLLSFRNEALSEARSALIRMEREIRQIKDGSSVYAAAATEFQFVDIYNATITYQLSANNLMRNADILAGGVSALTFTYYNATNQLIATPLVSPNETDISQIQMNIIVHAGPQSKTLQARVHPRNL